MLADPRSKDWAPRPDLAIHADPDLARRGARGRGGGARAARRARASRTTRRLFALELATRSSVEDEDAVLAELTARLAQREPAPVAMRVALANRWLLRGEPARALAALGEHAPAGAQDGLGLWFETRGRAFAAAGDLAAVQRTYASWRAAGGDPGRAASRATRSRSASPA